MAALVKSGFKLGNSVFTSLQKSDWLPRLLARITVGTVFLQSGWGKLHNIAKVVGYFTSLGLPAPEFQAHLVATMEFSCGLLLIAGLATRFVSFPLIITMVVALITAKKEEITGIPDLFGLSEFLYIVILVWLIFTGAGLLSLDEAVRRRLKRA